ncbi:MAG: glycosyltransferase family protein [Nitrososphaerota archaeon]|nr:hypothetical protein [Candidatus Calditenuaceae archaeon]MDW8072873.1 glycosyltransferase family protein [Nitrososphaerota archaeon]
MPRIHFSVCGLGLGHASRCRPLIFEALRRGYDVSVSTYGDAVDFFERLGLEVLRVPGLDYGRDFNGVVSIKATLLKNIDLPLKVAAQTLIEARTIQEFEADAVLSDTRASAVLASRLTGVPCTLLLNQYSVILQKDRLPSLANFFEDFVNSFTFAWSLSDNLLIADYPPPLTISRDNLKMRRKDRKRAEYVGPILERLPQNYPVREKLKESMGFDPSLPLVAIMPTGPRPDRMRFRDIMIRLLPELRDLQVVMTGVQQGFETEGGGRHRVFEWYEDEYELLAASDVVVTRAGQTLTAKALAFNCRLVITPILRQTEQESNAKSLSDNGVAIVLNERQISRDALSSAIKAALDEIDAAGLKKYSKFAEEVHAIDRIFQTLLKG